VGEGGRALKEGDERRLRSKLALVTIARGVEILSARERPAMEGSTPCKDLVKVLCRFSSATVDDTQPGYTHKTPIERASNVLTRV
jgi:hypothetical protein